MHKILAITLPLLMLSACASAGTGSGHGSDGLSGTRWRFVSIDGAPTLSPEANLNFSAGQLGASVGCNQMGGEWRIAGNRLMARNLFQTEMYCDTLMDQERALATLLTSAPELAHDGKRLTLRSGAHSAELTRAE